MLTHGETDLLERSTKAPAYQNPRFRLTVTGTVDSDPSFVKRVSIDLDKGISRAADLCKVSPPVCEDNLGIPRARMPQLSEEVTEKFLHELKAQGIAVRNRKVPVGRIKATQREINAHKAVGIAKKYLRGGFPGLGKDPVVLSSDNYILDGHHRWAALIISNPAAVMSTHFVGIPMRKLLKLALDFPGVFKLDFHERRAVVSFKNMFALTEESTHASGAVPRGEFDLDYPSSDGIVTPDTRKAMERFVFERTPERHRLMTASGEQAIVYFDQRGRASTSVMREIPDDELLALAKVRGWEVPGDPDRRPGSVKATDHGYRPPIEESTPPWLEEASPLESVREYQIARDNRHYNPMVKHAKNAFIRAGYDVRSKRLSSKDTLLTIGIHDKATRRVIPILDTVVGREGIREIGWLPGQGGTYSSKGQKALKIHKRLSEEVDLAEARYHRGNEFTQVRSSYQTALKRNYVDFSMVDPGQLEGGSARSVLRRMAFDAAMNLMGTPDGVSWVRDPDDVLSKLNGTPEELAHMATMYVARTVDDEYLGDDEGHHRVSPALRKMLDDLTVTVEPVSATTGEGYRMIMRPAMPQLQKAIGKGRVAGS